MIVKDFHHHLANPTTYYSSQCLEAAGSAYSQAQAASSNSWTQKPKANQ